MMRRLLSLLPWMVLAVTAYGQVRSADVLYTHHDTAPTRGYRVGDEVFVALDDVSRWDWTVTLRADLAQVKAEGMDFTVPTRTFNGRIALPLIAAVKKAGGMTSWDRQSDTLSVYSELTSVRFQDGKIKLTSPFRMLPRLFVDPAEKKFAIEIPGSRIGTKTQQFLDEGAALTQIRENVVRLEIRTDRVPDISKLRPTASNTFELDLPPLSEEVADPPITDQGEPPVTEQGVVPPVQNVLLPLQLDKETEKTIALSIPLGIQMTGAAQARRPEPEVLEITLPGIAMNLPDDFRLESQAIANVTRSYDGFGTVIRFELSRPMAAELYMDGTTVKINLIRPLISGTLIGKVVVVDPGHGGHDGGAKSGTVREKDLNLAIGKLIAERLMNEGATVIMTRKTDVFIPLAKRAQIANDSDADLFISSHINSTGGSATQTGTITFHHKGQQIARLLAECIHREVSKVNDLPDIGVWSDGKIYENGFAVLRQTKMPGVLLELGFINHPKDRAKMVTKEFQQNIAGAVVKGIKVFLGNAE